jgi:MFS family permease
LAGAWIDRRRRRPLLIGADYARAAVLAIIPIAALLGVLRFELLILVALLAGALTTIFDVAYVSILPDVVRGDQLTAANSRLQTSLAVAQASGPGLGGGLVALIGAPLTLALDAVSFLVSGVLLHSAPITESSRISASVQSSPTVLADIKQGPAALTRNHLLRATAWASVTTSLFGWGFLTVYLLFMTRDLELGARTIGVILTLGGLGSISGALLSGPVSNKLGVGRTMLLAQAANTLGSLAVPLAIVVPHLAVPMLAVSEIVQWGALTLFGVLQVSLRQAVVPGNIQGRVTATQRVLVTGGAALGGLLGGWLGTQIGLGPTLAVCALGMGLSVVWIAASPVPALQTIPSAVDDTAAASRQSTHTE